MGPAGMACPWCATRLVWSELGIDRTLGDALVQLKPSESDSDTSFEPGTDGEEGVDDAHRIGSLVWDPSTQVWTEPVPEDEIIPLVGQNLVDLTLSDSISSDEADQ